MPKSNRTTCIKCDVPLTSENWPSGAAARGRYTCRPCHNEMQRRWNRARLARMTDEERAARVKKLRVARVRSRTDESRKRERLNAAKWRAANPERAREIAREGQRRWAERNPEKKSLKEKSTKRGKKSDV